MVRLYNLEQDGLVEKEIAKVTRASSTILIGSKEGTKEKLTNVELIFQEDLVSRVFCGVR